jgi:alpha-galactosidase
VPGTRITIIGAGSTSFTPGLITDLIQTDDLAGSTLTLHDIDAEKLDVMTRLGRRMAKEWGAQVTIGSSLNREEALEGADFVIMVIQVGGIEAWRRDVDIPLEYGICQSVGDTVGPGGLSRALRTIPVVAQIALEMEELCPDAWLINYSNPMSAVCSAVHRATDIKVVGLCHGLAGTTGMLAGFLGEPVEDFEVWAAGINHLTWILDWRLRGEPAYPILHERLAQADSIPFPVSKMLYDRFGAFPSPGDRHVAEFYPSFLNKENDFGAKWGLGKMPLEQMTLDKDANWESLVARANGTEPLGEPKRSGEEALAIISAMVNHKDEVHVVNLPNRGFIEDLPEDALVEVHGLVGSYGIRGLQMGRLPAGVLPMTQFWIAQQQLTVDAALLADRDLALAAMANEPSVPSMDVAEKVLDDLMEAHKEYLPQMSH